MNSANLECLVRRHDLFVEIPAATSLRDSMLAVVEHVRSSETGILVVVSL